MTKTKHTTINKNSTYRVKSRNAQRVKFGQYSFPTRTDFLTFVTKKFGPLEVYQLQGLLALANTTMHPDAIRRVRHEVLSLVR